MRNSPVDIFDISTKSFFFHIISDQKEFLQALLQESIILLFSLSFPLVGNPSFDPKIQKDSLLSESPEATGRAGMTDAILKAMLQNTLISIIMVN